MIAGAREALEREGDVWWDALGDAESAAASFERASAIAPREPGPLAKHVAVLEGSGRYADAPRVYERSLAVLREPGERAAALLRQGLLLELRLGDREGAQRAYARALAESPALGLAQSSLARVYALMGRWNDWVALGVASAERVRDRTERAARMVSLALRCEYALGDRVTAQALYERALALDPTHAGAAETLAVAYRVQGRFDALAAMLEARYAALPDAYGKAPIARALGELYLDALRDPPRAIEWMRRAAQSPHPEDALAVWAGLARALAADPSRSAEYADAVMQQATRAHSPAERLALRMHHAALLEHRVRDRPRARFSRLAQERHFAARVAACAAGHRAQRALEPVRVRGVVRARRERLAPRLCGARRVAEGGLFQQRYRGPLLGALFGGRAGRELGAQRRDALGGAPVTAALYSWNRSRAAERPTRSTSPRSRCPRRAKTFHSRRLPRPTATATSSTSAARRRGPRRASTCACSPVSRRVRNTRRRSRCSTSSPSARATTSGSSSTAACAPPCW